MRELHYKVFVEDTGKTELVTGIIFDVEGNVDRIHVGHTEYVVNGDRNKFHLREFTGFKDKNQRRIYDGDILKFDDLGEEGYEYVEGFDFVNMASVCFYNGRFELTNFLSDDSAVFEDMTRDHEEFMSVFGISEVVGNIYEDPELINRARFFSNNKF